MKTLSLRLSESVHNRVRYFAKKDGVSINQFISSAITDILPIEVDVHNWTLARGVTVELRSNAPLLPQHFERFVKYVELAKEAAEDKENTEKIGEPLQLLWEGKEITKKDFFNLVRSGKITVGEVLDARDKGNCHWLSNMSNGDLVRHINNIDHHLI